MLTTKCQCCLLASFSSRARLQLIIIFLYMYVFNVRYCTNTKQNTTSAQYNKKETNLSVVWRFYSTQSTYDASIYMEYNIQINVNSHMNAKLLNLNALIFVLHIRPRRWWRHTFKTDHFGYYIIIIISSNDAQRNFMSACIFLN